MASSQQLDRFGTPLARGAASNGDTGDTPVVQPVRGAGEGSASRGWLPAAKRKAPDNTVISIFRKNRLMRVVMGEDVPFMCARCGLAFTHTDPLREHARLYHGYVEPNVILRDGQSPQIMMKRIFKPPKKNQTAPVQSEVQGERPTPSDVRNEPPAGEKDKEMSSDAESDTSVGVENISQSSPQEHAIPGSAGSLVNGDDSSSDGSYLGENTEGKEFKSFKNEIAITVRVQRPAGSLDDEPHSKQKHSSCTKKRKKKSKRGSYPCHFCGKNFNAFSKRKAHLKEVHRVFNTKEKAVEFQQKMQELSTSSEAGAQGTQTMQPLKCPHCPTYLAFESSLQRHLQSHCGTFGIKCDICKEGIQLWNEGKNQEIGGLLKKYKAELAEQGAGEDQDLPAESESDPLPKALEDSAVEGGNAAGESSKTSKGIETTAQEILRLSLEKAGRLGGSACIIDCIECGERFYLRQHLCNHYKTHAIFHCKSCPEAFNTMIALGDHCAKIHEEGCFQCFFCPKRFFSSGKSTYHMLGHLGLFQCICCGFTCMSKQSLEKHIDSYALEAGHAEPPEADVGMQYSSLNPFQTLRGRRTKSFRLNSKVQRRLPPISCKYCPRVFSREGSMRKHVLFQHPSEASPEDVNNSVICDQCGELFLSIQRLKVHQEIHKERTIPCSEVGCTAKFRSDRGLNLHLQQHKEKAQRPAGPRAAKCHICWKRFRTERNLRRHMLLHEGKNPAQCRFCDKVIPNTTALWYHEQQVHTDERNHECPHCKKRYACPSTLKVHLLTHSEEKPFVCEQCGMAFSSVVRMRAHQRIHTRPFKCGHCGEGFAQKGGRRNHLRKAHGVDEPMTRMYKGCSWSKVTTDRHQPRVSFGQAEEGQQEMEHERSLQGAVVILETGENGENDTTLGKYDDDATRGACEEIMLQLVEECKAQQLQ